MVEIILLEKRSYPKIRCILCVKNNWLGLLEFPNLIHLLYADLSAHKLVCLSESGECRGRI